MGVLCASWFGTFSIDEDITVIALQYGDISEMLKYLMYIFGQVLHMFCFSLQGQRLINHSIQLRDKIYNSSWYKIPVESQKLLLHVMRRSMEPCFLSAGKIYVFSLKSFTTVKIIYFIIVSCFFEDFLKNIGSYF
ncbi:PREDICTED: putative odorant receptor 85d [Acromyrmex echinatior]|uniref:putative odorant receptor 85d n=1 Tax=Acromyrmex echinatior TaxID=103372 RepID=UPI000580FEB6|nr:PREDICTED: putative odorant receptor 85d [Acromyrmex echinatior]